MNIVHIIPNVGPKSFGLGPVALNLVREQCKLGHDAVIWCLDSNRDRRWAAETNGLNLDCIRNFPVTPPDHIRWSYAMVKTARRESGRITVLHQHALWTGLSYLTDKMHRVHDIPTVVAPHGSLEKWALNVSTWKKRIALALYERRNLKKASCLYACSRQETAGMRSFGLDGPIAVIPNGVDDDWLASSGEGAAFRQKFDIPCAKRILLFLSRITPVKGLPLLLDAISTVRKHFDDWLLVIAGSDEFDHKSDLVRQISLLGLERYVVFTGLLLGQDKRDAFAAADLFVLPTKRENFGLVILEALSAGVPVITTHGAPWEELGVTGCGWQTPVSSDTIAGALTEALGYSRQELKQMGERGKTLAAQNYTWKRAADMTIELYRWLIGLGDRPDFACV